jgi:hypothetical protein
MYGQFDPGHTMCGNTWTRKDEGKKKKHTCTNSVVQAAAAEKIMEGIPEEISIKADIITKSDADQIRLDMEEYMVRRANGPMAMFGGFLSGLAKGFSICLAVWFALDADTAYMQVPGGWLYRYIRETHVTMVFVPYTITLPMKVNQESPGKPRLREYN